VGLVALIIGSVKLPGRPATPDAQWRLPIEVGLSGETPVYTSTDEFGRFFVSAPAQRSYTISVKGLNTLRNVKNNVYLQTGVNDLYVGELIGGDANNDNSVDVVDFSILRSVFDTSAARADFNGDGWVNIFDFSLFRANFGRHGDIVLQTSE
jgi:hypothetical protein